MYVNGKLAPYFSVLEEKMTINCALLQFFNMLNISFIKVSLGYIYVQLKLKIKTLATACCLTVAY